ncbi:uncharacterized protein [Elaeis guineensis]|uniref:uncharacterized protein n=1 Tax=Elaeis guineensis var. tenera TaxID=51953 RepID=UPI003C6DAE51
MKFKAGNVEHVLNGECTQVLEMVSGKQLNKMVHKIHQLAFMQLLVQEESSLLKGLPPKRAYDHKIVLKEGSQPINIRPYKYATLQKDAIEKIIQEMLDAGVIQHSTSPYSSPVVSLGEFKQIQQKSKLLSNGQSLEHLSSSEHYGHSARPLTDLLKKEAFHWTKQAQEAFELLKAVLIKTPVLALPDYSKVFIVKTDASGGELQVNPASHTTYTYYSGQLRMKGKFVATAKRISAMLYWPGLWKSVRNDIRSCEVRQKYKYENMALSGLLQPLPVPQGLFTDLTIDFIEGLPRSRGNSVIFVVVDRLTKFSHFFRLAYPYTAQRVAQVFMNGVFKLHGDSSIAAVDIELRNHEDHIRLLKHYLNRACHRMQQQADKYRTDCEFAIVIDQVGKVAYKLQLPSDALIHNVFHVSLLKHATASVVASQSLPPISQYAAVQPQAILDRHMVKRGNAAATQLLVHWQNCSPADAT